MAPASGAIFIYADDSSMNPKTPHFRYGMPVPLPFGSAVAPAPGFLVLTMKSSYQSSHGMRWGWTVVDG